MIPIVPDSSATAEQPVDPLRNRDGESLHAPTEIAIGLGLDEEVQVVPLDGEVNDPKGCTGRGCEAIPNGLKKRRAPERRHTPYDPKGHMDGMASLVARSPTMRDAGGRSRRLPPGALATPTPRPERKG